MKECACATGWASTGLKMYDKLAEVLRIETTLNAP